MAEKTVEYTVHDYDPLNKAIDENLRIKRTRSVWGYTKSAVLLMVGIGLLAVLLAWAYYLYKKPHRLVSLDTINEKVLKNEERIIDAEKKLPEDEEVSSSTGEKILEEKINKKDQEILHLKDQMQKNQELKNKEIQDLKEEIENNQGNEELKSKLNALENEKNEQIKKNTLEKQNLEQDKKELEKKLNEQSQIRTDVVHFKQWPRDKTAKIGELDGYVITRLHYSDPRSSKPDEITCYIDFGVEYSAIQFDQKNSSRYNSPYISAHLSKKVNMSDILSARSKCQYDYN